MGVFRNIPLWGRGFVYLLKVDHLFMVLLSSFLYVVLFVGRNLERLKKMYPLPFSQKVDLGCVLLFGESQGNRWTPHLV